MKFSRILIIGYGSIGQGLTPLLFRHFNLEPSNVQVITADDRGQDVAAEHGIKFKVNPITEDNFMEVMDEFVGNIDLIINVSVDVSSYALVQWCMANDVRYIDTCVEPWAGGYSIQNGSVTNYALRENILSIKGSPTALVAHGANPGLVSHFVREGLKELAKARGFKPQGTFGEQARALGIKVIHIAERDTQDDGLLLRQNEFKNTWSVDGFISEAIEQLAEAGWGTHEEKLPYNAMQHSHGCKASIVLENSGMSTTVKSWVPTTGPQEAYLVTHHEAISLADYLTVGDKNEPQYRPTVYYAYRPCPQAIESLNNVFFNSLPPNRYVMKPIMGHDELGVLLLYEGGAYWYGSTLTHEEAVTLAPHNSATTLQVTATMMAAIKWMQKNPDCGVVEAENVDFDEVLALSLPYLGLVRGIHTNWQPKPGSRLQFEDFLTK